MRTINWKRTMQCCLLMGIAVMMLTMPIRICAEATERISSETEVLSESGTAESSTTGSSSSNNDNNNPDKFSERIILFFAGELLFVFLFYLGFNSIMNKSDDKNGEEITEKEDKNSKKKTRRIDRVYFYVLGIAAIMIVSMAAFMISVLVSAQIEAKSTDQNITSFVGIVLTIVGVAVGLPAIYSVFEKKELAILKQELTKITEELEKQQEKASKIISNLMLTSNLAATSEEPHIKTYALLNKVKNGVNDDNKMALLMLIGHLERQNLSFTRSDKNYNDEKIIRLITDLKENNILEDVFDDIRDQMRLKISLAQAYYRLAYWGKEDDWKERLYYEKAKKLWDELLESNNRLDDKERNENEKEFLDGYFHGQKALCLTRIDQKEKDMRKKAEALKETIGEFEAALRIENIDKKTLCDEEWWQGENKVFDDTLLNSYAAALQRKARIADDFKERICGLYHAKKMYEVARGLFPEKQRVWSNIGATTRDIFYALLQVNKDTDIREIKKPIQDIQDKSDRTTGEELSECLDGDTIKQLYEKAELSLSQAKELDPSFIDSYLVTAELEYQMVMLSDLHIIEDENKDDHLKKARAAIDLAGIIDKENKNYKRLDEWYEAFGKEK